jgi:hypothetical protein
MYNYGRNRLADKILVNFSVVVSYQTQRSYLQRPLRGLKCAKINYQTSTCLQNAHKSSGEHGIIFYCDRLDDVKALVDDLDSIGAI